MKSISALRELEKVLVKNQLIRGKLLFFLGGGIQIEKFTFEKLDAIVQGSGCSKHIPYLMTFAGSDVRIDLLLLQLFNCSSSCEYGVRCPNGNAYVNLPFRNCELFMMRHGFIKGDCRSP